jgi:hypothetical protein
VPCALWPWPCASLCRARASAPGPPGARGQGRVAVRGPWHSRLWDCGRHWQRLVHRRPGCRACTLRCVVCPVCEVLCVECVTGEWCVRSVSAVLTRHWRRHIYRYDIGSSSCSCDRGPQAGTRWRAGATRHVRNLQGKGAHARAGGARAATGSTGTVRFCISRVRLSTLSLVSLRLCSELHRRAPGSGTAPRFVDQHGLQSCVHTRGLLQFTVSCCLAAVSCRLVRCFKKSDIRLLVELEGSHRRNKRFRTH